MVRVSRHGGRAPPRPERCAARRRRARRAMGFEESRASGSPSLSLVATAVLCASGVAMYAASTIISAEQIRDVRMKVDATRRSAAPCWKRSSSRRRAPTCTPSSGLVPQRGRSRRLRHHRRPPRRFVRRACLRGRLFFFFFFFFLLSSRSDGHRRGGRRRGAP